MSTIGMLSKLMKCATWCGAGLSVHDAVYSSTLASLLGLGWSKDNLRLVTTNQPGNGAPPFQNGATHHGLRCVFRSHHRQALVQNTSRIQDSTGLVNPNSLMIVPRCDAGRRRAPGRACRTLPWPGRACGPARGFSRPPYSLRQRGYQRHACDVAHGCEREAAAAVVPTDAAWPSAWQRSGNCRFEGS